MSNAIHEPFLLWLPSYMVEDEQAIADVTKANGLILDYCDGDISLEQVFDEFNDLRVDLDDYSQTLEFIRRNLGA